MPDITYKEVSRAFIYYIDDVNQKIHGLLVQRPTESGREPDKLSLIGGTNDPENNADISADPTIDRFLLHLHWHLRNELGLTDQLETIEEVNASITLEPSTFIEWTTVNFMVRVSEMKSFEDLQPLRKTQHRPIEWFTIDSDDADGVIFRQHGATLIPVRPIYGKDPSEGFGSAEIAFDQYETISQAVEKIKRGRPE